MVKIASGPIFKFATYDTTSLRDALIKEKSISLKRN
jgi:hypothetical protein